MATVKRILESDNNSYRTQLMASIGKAQRGQTYLDNVINTAIVSSVNRMVNSKRLDRLNILVDCLAEGKQSARISTLAKNLPTYLGLQTCLTYNARHKVFCVTDSKLFLLALNSYTMPSANFYDWLKDNRVKALPKDLTESEAVKKITALLVAMRKSPHCQGNAIFANLMLQLEDFALQNGSDFQALNARLEITNN